MERRLLRWFNGENAPPIKITIYPTFRCNLNCKFCGGSEDTHRPDKLNRDGWLNLVSEGVNMGIREWEFSGGGEPLLKSDLFIQMTEKIKSKPENECILITNGTFIDKDVAKRFVEVGIDRIYFSLDSPRAEIHDELRQVKGTFRRVENALDFLNQSKESMNKEKPELGISSVLTERNYRELGDMVQFAYEKNCNKVKFQSMVVYDELKPDIEKLEVRDKEKLHGRIEEASEIADEKDIELQVDSLGLSPDISEEVHEETNEVTNKGDFFNSPCFEPWRSMMIDPEGRAGPCCSWEKGIEGVTFQDQGLEGIWHGGQFQSIRENILNHNLYDNCKGCGFKDRTEHLMESLLNRLKED